MNLLDIPAYMIAIAILFWASFSFFFLKRSEYIGAVLVGFYFCFQAIVDLLLGGRSIPTGQIIIMLFGPLLVVSNIINHRPSFVTKYSLLILLFMLAIVISIIWSDLSFWANKSSLTVPLFGLLIYMSVSSMKEIKLIIIVFLGFVVLSSIIAAFQYAGVDAMYLPSQRSGANAGGYRRAMGLANHFSQLGLYCAASIPLAVMIALSADTKKVSIFWLLPAAFGFAGLTFTALRSGLIGGIIGLVIAMYLWNKEKMASYLVKYGVLVLVLILLTPVLRESSVNIVDHTAKLDSSAMNRPKLALIGFDMFLSSPVFGIGPEGPEKGNLDPHNTFVNVLADYGIFGFSIFICIVFITLRSLYRKHNWLNDKTGIMLGLLGASIAALIVAFFHSVNYIHLFWLFPALAMATHRISNVDRQEAELVKEDKEEKPGNGRLNVTKKAKSLNILRKKNG